MGIMKGFFQTLYTAIVSLIPPFLPTFNVCVFKYKYIYSFTDELQMSGGDNQIKQLKMYIRAYTKLYKSI